MFQQYRNLTAMAYGFFILTANFSAYLAAQVWQPANGPYAGKINALFFTPDGSCLAGTDQEGIYRKSTGSGQWQSVNTGVQHRTVWCFARNASGGLFEGTHYGGVYFSSNGGESWLPRSDGLTSLDIRSLTSTRNNVLITGTVSGGAFRSTDNGLNWIAASDGMNAPMILSLVTDSSNNLFAGTAGQGVFRSTDDGLNWFAANNGISNLFIWSMAAGPENELLAGTMGGGVHRSTNAGQSWTSAGVSESYINALAITPQNEFYAGTRGMGVYRSTNRGVSWSRVSSSLPDSVFWSLAFDPSGTIYTGSDKRGFFQSANHGQDWIPYGVPTVRLFCLHVSGSADFFAGAYRNGLYFSTDNGIHWNWAPLLSQNTDVYAVLTVPSQYIFLATQYDGVIRSGYPAVSWMKINNGLPTAGVNTLASAYGFVYAGTRGKGIYRSSDDGDSWHSTGLTSTFVKNIIRVPPHSLFAASLGNGIFRSTDQGMIWFPANTGLSSLFIYDLLFDSDGYLYAAADNGGIFRSANQGLSWEEKNAGITGKNIRTLAVDANALYAGGAGSGLFVSSDHGDTWMIYPSSDSLENIVGIHSAITLAVATEYKGINHFTPAISVEQNSQDAKPDRFRISVSPNPFNAQVTLQIYLPGRDKIGVSIFNILGQELMRTDMGLLTPGWSRFTWNGKDRNGNSCASGLYLFRVQGSHDSAVKKIMLIR